MRQKPIFGAFAPRGEKGSRERLKRLAEVLPDNTWNKTSLKMKKIAPVTKMAPTTFEELLSCKKC